MEKNSFHLLKSLATAESQLLTSMEERKILIQMMWTGTDEEEDEVNTEKQIT
jgi:hypothetical protein